MKTAISVPDELFKEVEKVAKENHYSRSEVFSIAVREYLEKRKSKRLLADLNEACEAAESPEEYKVRDKSKRRYSKTVLKERFLRSGWNRSSRASSSLSSRGMLRSHLILMCSAFFRTNRIFRGSL